MSIRLKKIELFLKSPRPAHVWLFSAGEAVATEQYQAERAFYTRACKGGRLVRSRAAQVAPALGGKSHVFTLWKPGRERSCHLPPAAPGLRQWWGCSGGAAPPGLEAVHQKHLEKLGGLGENCDTVPCRVSSWLEPKPGLLLYSLVSGKTLGCGRLG